jgi:hypothetical protein
MRVISPAGKSREDKLILQPNHLLMVKIITPVLPQMAETPGRTAFGGIKNNDKL